MPKYKWNSAMDWFSDKMQSGDIGWSEIELLITENIDNDMIQDHFQSSMDEDGFFDEIDPGGQMEFITDCVGAYYPGKTTQQVADEIWDMAHVRSVTIEYETFIERVSEEELKEKFPDYMWDGVESPLTGNNTLEDDWAVEFCESIFFGRMCYYIVHSGIEYIWCAKESE